tara:strand:- start:3218 stop:3556 length:339 start_codon:yes stop_codon:yes gene_type:complete
MKKTVLTIGIAMLFVVGSTTFISCGNSENQDSEAAHEHAEGEEHHDEMEMTEEGNQNEHHDDMEMSEEDHHEHHMLYECPMKCEGDKMYEEAGSCPKCGMDLKEVEKEVEEE